MSQKFHLVQDRDQDGFFASIKRHAAAFAVLVLVLFAILAIVIGSFTFGAFKSGFDQQRRLAANQARIAERDAPKKAMKEKVNRFVDSGEYTAYSAIVMDTPLYAGPGISYGQIGRAKGGETVTLIARDEAGVWILLDDKTWVQRDHVYNASPRLAVFGNP